LKFVFEITSGGHPVRETARRARTAVTYARDDAIHVWPLPPANFRNIGQCTSLWQPSDSINETMHLTIRADADALVTRV